MPLAYPDASWGESGRKREGRGQWSEADTASSQGLVLAGTQTGPDSLGGDCPANSLVPQMKKQSQMVSPLRAWGTPRKTATHWPQRVLAPARCIRQAFTV